MTPNTSSSRSVASRSSPEAHATSATPLPFAWHRKGRPSRSKRAPARQRCRGSSTRSAPWATGYLADITHESDVQRLIQCAISEFGRLDILVNNAAVRSEGSLESVSLDEWRSILAIILDGAFLCCRETAPHLRRSDAGGIVNIGGMTGSSGGSERVHVVTGKAGSIGLTKALAWDLADDDVTVNLISPGMVATQRSKGSAEKPKHHAVHHPLLGRRGTPEEIAGMVMTLCGPDRQATSMAAPICHDIDAVLKLHRPT